MYETIIIAISCAISIALLSKADLKITINHNYPQPIVDKVDNSHDTISEAIDKTYDDEKLPTFDDVLNVVQELIGGELDAD